MPVIQCSQKLFKRLRLPASETEPEACQSPLGEWCADIDFIDRHPFVLVMNVATAVVLVLPARAADLKQLHVMARQQLAGLLDMCGIDSVRSQAELDAWRMPPQFVRNHNRSLAASLSQRKQEAWIQFAHGRKTAFEVAMRMLETPFSRKDLGRDFHFAIDLLRARLAFPASNPVQSSGTLH